MFLPILGRRVVFLVCISMSRANKGHRPPGLRGKEIGLWHAAQSKNRCTGHLDYQTKFASMPLVGLNLPKIQSVIQEFVEPVPELPKTSNELISFMCKLPTLSTSKQTPEDEAEELFGEIRDCFDVSVGPCSDPDQMLLTKESLARNPDIDHELCLSMRNCMSSAAYMKMSESRCKLPAYQFKEDIVSTIRDNQVVIISGETGCGKTTQVPQFILEDQVLGGNGSVTRIIVTQPRRISAVSIAERVATERGQSVGSSVGYQVRLERRYPQRPHGSIMFCTTGIILQWFRSDPLLKNISHIIVDEVHEREFLCDFLLCMLKRIAPLRPDLRIVLMSATINADKFVEYFDNCPKFEIPGRTFPVKTYYLEDVLRETKFWLPNSAITALCRDQSRTLKQRLLKSNLSKKEARILSYGKSPEFNKWLHSLTGLSSNAIEILRSVGEDTYPKTDLIAHSVEHILQSTQSGAILVFVPGLVDIKDVIRCLRELNPRRYDNRYGSVRIYPLHSRIPTSRDRSLFEPSPKNQRKVVIATNIAETSITIQDVVYVIDCGRIKVTDYDPRQNTSTLTAILVSKANAAQRSGRAGRVQPGICYHLFPSYVYNNVMSDFLQPEMLRVRLEDVILRIKLLGLGRVKSFLTNCLDSPSEDAISKTLIFLRQIQALKLIESETSNFNTSHSIKSRGQSHKLNRKSLREFSEAIKKDVNASGINILGSSCIHLDSTDEDDDELTPLGVHLANFPLDPQCAKLLIFGALFGCLEPILAVASCLTFRDPFEVPLEKQQEADRCRKELSQNSFSDHWVFATVIQSYNGLNSQIERHQFCQRYFLNERNINLFRAIMCAALYPNVVKVDPRFTKEGKPKTSVIMACPSEGRANIHPSSVNSKIQPTEPIWMVYFTKTKLESGSYPSIFDSTVISLRPLLFFSGNIEISKNDTSLFTIDQWIKFSGELKVVNLLKDLRKCMDGLLEQKFKSPSVANWDSTNKEGRLLQTIVDLLTSEPPPAVQVEKLS
ncbi:putative atp-dependent RNA helicase [Schistosoma mansoni]|uniref:putative atp-dependent RNA helicase n=1 Tax=Schistosoma mansoni TaxID=6183 RepID=UPI0001A6350D|nr:putative atp-dependent RNA helicase [Schistosoma mansoni]|eukprot:XP_018648522.1 putative atp-dependent RNA helicase [Schistosoma mansoni]